MSRVETNDLRTKLDSISVYMPGVDQLMQDFAHYWHGRIKENSQMKPLAFVSSYQSSVENSRLGTNGVPNVLKGKSTLEYDTLLNRVEEVARILVDDDFAILVAQEYQKFQP